MVNGFFRLAGQHAGLPAPRLRWSQKTFFPWISAPAYLVCGWLYEAHRRKVPSGADKTGYEVYDMKQ